MPDRNERRHATPDNRVLAAGLVSGLIAVVLAAIAAHGPMAPTDPTAQRQVDTAILMHFVHTLGLMLVAFWPAPASWRAIITAGWLLGILLFSGSLYALTLFSQPWPGLLTPLGGLFLTLGWIAWLVGLSVVRQKA